MNIEEKLNKVQQIIGYEFNDISLLLRAITHSSAISENLGKVSYERLEYLGDAVLELLVTRLLFNEYPNANEGQMTKIRAAVVSEKPLSEIADKLGLGNFLIFGHGMEKSGGKKLSSILCDETEAIIGAIYLDGGIDKAARFIMPKMMPRIEIAYEQGFKRDYKTRLQEYLQRNGKISIKYKTENEEGPAHDKSFFTTVYVDDKPKGTGVGKSKKISQQQAAKDALIKLDVMKK